MDDMVRDMRRRFLVAAVLSVPILLWSPIGREVLGFRVPAPFGLRDDVFSRLLSLPVIFYSAWIFFAGAVRALRAKTLDMMVLVAVGVGTGWLYSAVVTLTGGGEVFCEAATVLTTFVLLGHWFEMRARGGANDAVRTLLELAPAMALVLRDGAPVEVPTGEVQVGDLLLVRPGAKVPVDATVEDGESDVDESMVAGESLPVAKAPGQARARCSSDSSCPPWRRDLRCLDHHRYHRCMPMKSPPAQAVTAPVVEELPALGAAACMFRSLGDPARLAIIQHLALGEHRVVDLTAHLGLAQSTVSSHLACLRDCGLVTSRPQGRASMFSLAQPELLVLLASAERLLAATGDAVVLCPTYGRDAVL